VRERFTVDELVGDGERVTGIRGHDRSGRSVVDNAHLVVGADGKHSTIAAAVAAATYHERPTLSVACYTYWQDLPVNGGEIYGRPRRAIGLWPTNDGLTLSYFAWPIDDDARLRDDLDGGLRDTTRLVGGLADRLHAATRVERFHVTRDLPNFFRASHGPGWALVGDAGLVMDPITGRGITDAFRQSELLVAAIADGLDGSRPLHGTLAHYQHVRDAETRPMYEFTTELASFGPPTVEQRVLFAALAGNQHQTDRFLGVITGITPLTDYMTPRNLRSIIGLRGFAKIALGRARRPRRQTPTSKLIRQDTTTSPTNRTPSDPKPPTFPPGCQPGDCASNGVSGLTR